jgi:hypothetical protein
LLRRNVDAAVVLLLLESVNATHCRPPLPGKEVEQIVSSICKRELEQRQERGHGG